MILPPAALAGRQSVTEVATIGCFIATLRSLEPVAAVAAAKSCLEGTLGSSVGLAHDFSICEI